MLSVRRMREFAHMEVSDKCERCNKTKALDVHHKDENPLNNDETNLITLCRSCHMKAHVKIVLCRICKAPQKGLGLCNKHYMRLKKWGDPLAIKVNQNTPVILSED